MRRVAPILGGQEELMRFALLALLAFAVAGSALAQQTPAGNQPSKPATPPKPGDMVTNPAYSHWAAFAVGTSITQKEAVQLADGTILESLMTSKLVKKDKDKLTVETTVVAADAAKRSGAADESKTLSTYPAKVRYEDIHNPDSGGYSVTEGKEVVDVKGKPVEAAWIEASTTNSDGSVTEKDWYAIDIPGGLVKQTVTKKKGSQVTSQSTLEVVEIKSKAEPKKQ
ncbi:MAG TPA: hypothetical protein VKE73_09015 [Myxococcota bacterium]|nr:hypothetical protein [Myxococcota bacterium]